MDAAKKSSQPLEVFSKRKTISGRSEVMTSLKGRHILMIYCGCSVLYRKLHRFSNYLSVPQRVSAMSYKTSGYIIWS